MTHYTCDMTHRLMIPLTEEIRLKTFGSPDYTVLPYNLGTPFTPVKHCFNFWGLPWKVVWKLRGLPWKVVENLAVVIIWSLISSVRGMWHDSSRVGHDSWCVFHDSFYVWHDAWCVFHDSFYVWHDSSTLVGGFHLSWCTCDIDSWHMGHDSLHVGHDSLPLWHHSLTPMGRVYITWYARDMTRHMCATTHSYVWQDSPIWVTEIIQTW